MKRNWEFGHSGIFVKDFDKTIRYFRDLGLAPDLGQTQNPFSPEDKTVTTVFGKVQPPRDPNAPYFLQLLYIGDLELEVLHAPAEPPQGDALAYGEGINHLCFNVPDIDKETDELVEKGMRLVLDFKKNGERLEDYLDTREHGNIFLSLRTLQTDEVKRTKAGYGIVDWKFQGHTAVVNDSEATAEFYTKLDVAEVQPRTIFDSSTIDDIKVNGLTPQNVIKARSRTAKLGPVAIDFVQPLQGESIFSEYLERKGEGIIDIVFSVDDLDKETARLTGKGVPVIFSGKPRDANAFACFDTRANGGDVLIKLVQR